MSFYRSPCLGSFTAIAGAYLLKTPKAIYIKKRSAPNTSSNLLRARSGPDKVRTEPASRDLGRKRCVTINSLQKRRDKPFDMPFQNRKFRASSRNIAARKRCRLEIIKQKYKISISPVYERSKSPLNSCKGVDFIVCFVRRTRKYK